MTKADILPKSDLYKWFNTTIYYFHVPLFFICSGYLYQKYSKAVKVYPNSKEWFTIVSSQKQALMKTNVGSSMNDISIFNLQRYYKIKI